MRRSLTLGLVAVLLSSVSLAQGTNRQVLVIDEPSATTTSINFSIGAPKSPDGTPASLYMGFGQGTTILNQMGMNFVVPLNGPVVPIATTIVRKNTAMGPATIPALPAGVTAADLWFAGVVFDARGHALVTAAIPFGPIIEDAIQ